MNEKADSDLVKRQNRGLVLQALRRGGAMARIDLGRVTGLSLATISSISGQLIAEGLIEPIDVPEFGVRQRRGRPLTLLDLNPRAATVLAVSLSVDGVELVLADFRGRQRHREIIPIITQQADATAFGSQIAGTIRAFLARVGVQPAEVARIGVAIQGVTASDLGAIAWSPAFTARNIAIIRPIEMALGIPVSLGNDANMIAEALLGNEPDFKGTTVVLFTGHGVGMALIVDGKVFHGDTGAAAEFGHMNHIPHGALCRCGRRGCIEAYVADYGILRAAHGSPQTDAPRDAVPEQTILDLEQAAQAGVPAARAAFAQAGEVLGYGIARIIALLNPSRIVITGPGARAMPLFQPALQNAIEDGLVEELRRNVAISIAAIDTDMIIKGTIDSALRHLDREVFARHGGLEPALRSAG